MPLAVTGGEVCWKRVTNAAGTSSPSSCSARASSASIDASAIASRSASSTRPLHGSTYVR